MLAALELQLVIAAQLLAFLGALHTKQPQPCRCLRDRVVARVGDADHQCRPALKMADDRMTGEDETGARPRETGEDQSRHHREKAHAGEDFDRRDEMPVIGLRVHVAVADCRQRLDREIEQAQRQRQCRGNVGNRLRSQPVHEGKNCIENDEDQRGDAEEYRPVYCHGAMIEIAPESRLQPTGLDLARPDVHDVRFVRSLERFFPRFLQPSSSAAADAAATLALSPSAADRRGGRCLRKSCADRPR